MSTLTLIIIFSLIGGALSVLAAASYLIVPEGIRTKSLPHMVSFAIGALLGAAFLALLPHALTQPGVTDMHKITGTVLAGILGFFVLEKMVLWRHCHTASCEVHGAEEAHSHAGHHHPGATASLVLIGDAVHNTVDGVLIAVAFMTDEHLGIVTALAVAAHEIPQEVGDFAILLQSGYSRRKALFFNMLASLTTVVGAVGAYYSLSDMQSVLPYVLALAASSFIYVAVADLIPGLHRQTALRDTLKQISLIGLGVLVIYAAHRTLHG